MVDAGASSANGRITKIDKASSHSTLAAKSADEYLLKDAWKNGLQLLALNKPLECTAGASHPIAFGADSLHHPYQHHHLLLLNLHSLQANPLQETSEYCTAEIWLSGKQGKFHCRLLWLFYIYEHKPLCNVTTSRGLACLLTPSVQILFIHVYCIAVQSSVQKYDNICVTSLLFIFEAVSSTQHIYISFCTISYIWKHFSLQKIFCKIHQRCVQRPK